MERSEFDYENDRLICLGDVADGWPDTRASINELLKIKCLTYILGNHDWWTLQWMLTGRVEDTWYRQGGKATIESYPEAIPPEHLAFLSEASLYHVHENKLFVHAGIYPSKPLDKQDQDIFLWDRTLAMLALGRYPHSAEGQISTFDEIYVGHTPIPYPHPIRSLGV